MVKMRYYIVFLALFFTSCFHEEEYGNTKVENFELLWKTLNDKYCFFDYKKIDWDDIHKKYSVRIKEQMSNESFFDILGEMLAELQDGHVNLYASHNVARYWKWFEDYPENFDSKIQKNYLGNDYLIASSIKYRILEDNIGYIYYASFSNAVGDGNLNQVIGRLAICKGIIVDVRGNGGGLLSNVDKIASRFFTEKTLVGYIMYKTGRGHSDFSEPFARYIEPATGLKYSKPVVVLTNRGCFSATNDFVNAMSYAPNVTIIGDKTGGGSGLPFSSELPNGWSVRFSASPMLNAKKEQIEFGIDPDIKVDMTITDMLRGVDTIIEVARAFIKQPKNS